MMSLIIPLAIAYLLIMAGFLLWSPLLKGRRTLSPQLLELSITAGGAFLLGICFTDLVPEAFGSSESSLLTASFVLLGLVVQIVIDYLTDGAEHGHHHQEEQIGMHTNVERHFPLLGLMLGLCIHSFFEGIPLARYDDGIVIDRPLMLGIVLHNIPIGYILVQMLRQNQIKVGKGIALLLLLAIMTPLGSLLGLTVLPECSEQVEACAIAFVVGILLHVSLSLLFDHQHHRFSWSKLTVIVVAFVLVIVLSFSA